METRGLFSLLNFLRATCGALGSTISMSILHPLEIARTRLQVDPNLEPRSSIPLVLSLGRKEGLTALYRGWSSLVLALSVTNFIYFYTFHGLRSMNMDRMVATDMIYGVIAGVAAVLVSNPLWVVNTRIKLQGVSHKGESKKMRYSSIISCLFGIAQTEGLQALWSGTSSSLLLVSNPTVQFVVYESLKRSPLPLPLVPSDSHILYIMNGAVAKVAATAATYPLQVVQTQRRAGVLPRNGNILLHISMIIQRDGVGGLFYGLETKLIQTSLNAAIMFFVYEELVDAVFAIADVER